MERKKYITKMADLWQLCMQMEKFDDIRMKMIYITSSTKNQDEAINMVEKIVKENLNNEAKLEEELDKILETKT